MKNWKSSLILFFLVFTLSDIVAQDKPVVVVDDYFTKKDSSFVAEYLGENLIKQIDVILPDSAIKIIGDIGKHGIIRFSTNDLKNEKVEFLKNEENNLFHEKPIVIVNGAEIENFEMSSLNPAKIISVYILTPFRAAQKYGETHKNGMISIKVNQD